MGRLAAPYLPDMGSPSKLRIDASATGIPQFRNSQWLQPLPIRNQVCAQTAEGALRRLMILSALGQEQTLA